MDSRQEPLKYPPFVGNKEHQELYNLFTNLTSKQEFEQRWQEISKDFLQFETTTPVGSVSVKQWFIQKIFKEFPEFLNEPKISEKIATILFETLLTPGEEVNLRNGELSGTIIRREVTTRGGILIAIKKKDGSIFTWEYFD